jgi:hypothetical protein
MQCYFHSSICITVYYSISLLEKMLYIQTNKFVCFEKHHKFIVFNLTHIYNSLFNYYIFKLD